MSRHLATFGWLLLPLVCAADPPPLLIDFDGNVQSDYRLGVVESGFRFTGPYSTTMVSFPLSNTQGAFNGTPNLLSFQYPMTMQRRDGQPFTLLTLDIGWYWLPDGVTSDTVSATLMRVDGTMEVRSKDLPWGVFQDWSFDVEMMWVTFEQPAFTSLRYDNIAVLAPSPVPEPPAAAMALLGLGAMSWMVRRRQHPLRSVTPPEAETPSARPPAPA